MLSTRKKYLYIFLFIIDGSKIIWRKLFQSIQHSTHTHTMDTRHFNFGIINIITFVSFLSIFLYFNKQIFPYACKYGLLLKFKYFTVGVVLCMCIHWLLTAIIKKLMSKITMWLPFWEKENNFYGFMKVKVSKVN